MPSVRFVPCSTTWFQVPVGPLAELTDVTSAAPALVKDKQQARLEREWTAHTGPTVCPPDAFVPYRTDASAPLFVTIPVRRYPFVARVVAR